MMVCRRGGIGTQLGPFRPQAPWGGWVTGRWHTDRPKGGLVAGSPGVWVGFPVGVLPPPGRVENAKEKTHVNVYWLSASIFREVDFAFSCAGKSAVKLYLLALPKLGVHVGGGTHGRAAPHADLRS